MAQQILAPATGAVIGTGMVVVRTERNVTIFASPPLVAAEVAGVQISPDNGQTWVQPPIATFGQLTSTQNRIALNSPGLYRVSKGATVTATAIYAATEDNA